MGALAWIGVGIGTVCAACFLGVAFVALRDSWIGDSDGDRDRLAALILGIGMLALVGAAGYGGYAAATDDATSNSDVEALKKGSRRCKPA